MSSFKAPLLGMLGVVVAACSKEPPAAAVREASVAQEAAHAVAETHSASPAQPTFAEESPSAPAEGPQGGPANAPDEPQCEEICARSTELKCKEAAQCRRMCNESMSNGPCSTEMRGATSCMVRHPASDWECTPEGLAAIKDGICVSEQEAVATCLGKLLGTSP